MRQELGHSDEELLSLRKAKEKAQLTHKKSRKEFIGKKPLEGVKIADFSSALVGPFTTKPLADYGAQMIHIESKRWPDMRTTRPFKDRIQGFNRSAYFNREHTSQLSIALNLASPKGIEIAKQIVAWADIVVENFAGGAMDKMGLGYKELKKIKPDIIMVSSCMMGQTGPYSRHPGYGRPLTALTGFTNITGWPDRDATDLNVYTDFVAPHFNSLAILAALDYRERTGKGQYIDLSQYESCLHFMEPLILDYNINERIANRNGNRNPYAVPHGAFRCSGEDRWCAIAIFNDEEWGKFCKVVGSPAWIKDPRFATFQARKENEDELEKMIGQWTINHSAEEVMSMMQAAGLAAGVLETGKELMEDDPQLKSRRLFWQLRSSGGREVPCRKTSLYTI